MSEFITNAELRIEAERLCDDNEHLREENEKLRELVRDILRWMPCPTHCYHCERYHYHEGCEFEIRWRDLRIKEN